MDERNFLYMFYGFTAAWLIVAVYLVLLVMREKRIQGEIDRVRALLEDRSGRTSAK
jgi:CcmD family protein